MTGNSMFWSQRLNQSVRVGCDAAKTGGIKPVNRLTNWAILLALLLFVREP